jgi:hypothetical protein
MSIRVAVTIELRLLKGMKLSARYQVALEGSVILL